MITYINNLSHLFKVTLEQGLNQETLDFNFVLPLTWLNYFEKIPSSLIHDIKMCYIISMYNLVIKSRAPVFPNFHKLLCFSQIFMSIIYEYLTLQYSLLAFCSISLKLDFHFVYCFLFTFFSCAILSGMFSLL